MTIALQLRGLEKTYGRGDTAVHALRAVTLDIEDGELMMLLGPSGSGKSTLLNILGGLDHASSGQFLFHGAGYASQAAFDAAATALTVANATLSARKADLRRARVAAGLGNGETREIVQVKSPAAGQVLRLYQQSEAVIAAGTPLLDIGNPDNIEVVAEFLTQDAVRMHTGDPAYVENWGGGPPIAATVTRIEPFARTKVSALGVEEQRVNVIAQLAAPRDAPRLGHGFRVDLRVLVARQDDVVRLPSDALVRDGRDWGVYTVRDHRLVFRRVRIGEASGPFRPVLSGLHPGDPIVLFPSDALRPGLTVRVTSGQAP